MLNENWIYCKNLSIFNIFGIVWMVVNDGGNVVITGGTTGCHNDNMWCHKWR